MADYKTILGVVAVVISIFGYVPYFRDIISGKIHQHVKYRGPQRTLFIWPLVTVLWFIRILLGFETEYVSANMLLVGRYFNM